VAAHSALAEAASVRLGNGAKVETKLLGMQHRRRWRSPSNSSATWLCAPAEWAANVARAVHCWRQAVARTS